jgi:hypothetical protein
MEVTASGASIVQSYNNPNIGMSLYFFIDSHVYLPITLPTPGMILLSLNPPHGTVKTTD